MSLLKQAEEIGPRWIEFRRELHRHPELSLQESGTAARIARELDRLGIPYRSGVGGHGIVAELAGSGSGKTIALRADMDALPIEERTGLPFASEHAGIMHACGHDAHAAMLLGAAELLRGEALDGTVRLLFQPAEEINAGAKAMLEEGALDGVEEIYGLHNLPTLAAGRAATRPGPMMGSVDRIELEVKGKGAHGALPEQGVDPIVCAAAIVQALQTIVSRELSPFASAVVTIGSIHGGEANNVIPDRCRLTGTVRAFDPDVRERLRAAIGRVAEGIAASHRCQVRLAYIGQVPVLANDVRAASLAERAIDGILGAERRDEAEPVLAGEDFSLYLGAVPGCFFWIGSGPERDAERAYGLHHPRYELNEACIPVGIALLAGIARESLKAPPLEGF
ncbi:M20 metallopeptidase family protein [Paenibacillus sp. B01]|uniref:M20 metallopeptidase family protein n=1 Tax=Paenibacillus sp. B01 TaxID=2660554 RepID=UPI00129C0D86|nr:M20 family metallopeptidase [Paenibacillus sp. B01]QGG57177.1 amidohydrolase [Paenibacillus sp. B01]